MTHAAALTPSLFLGCYLPFDHVVTTSVTEAVTAVESGSRVLVCDETLAMEIMRRLGLTADEAQLRLVRATCAPAAGGDADVDDRGGPR